MVTHQTFLEGLRAKMRPIMNRQAILDSELAELLGIQQQKIRAMVARHRPHLSDEDAFHPASETAGCLALTEVGALFLVFRMRTTLAAAISVQVIREVVGAAEPSGGQFTHMEMHLTSKRPNLGFGELPKEAFRKRMPRGVSLESYQESQEIGALQGKVLKGVKPPKLRKK